MPPCKKLPSSKTTVYDTWHDPYISPSRKWPSSKTTIHDTWFDHPRQRFWHLTHCQPGNETLGPQWHISMDPSWANHSFNIFSNKYARSIMQDCNSFGYIHSSGHPRTWYCMYLVSEHYASCQVECSPKTEVTHTRTHTVIESLMSTWPSQKYVRSMGYTTDTCQVTPGHNIANGEVTNWPLPKTIDRDT
jgi:hypothetical protein